MGRKESNQTKQTKPLHKAGFMGFSHILIPRTQMSPYLHKLLVTGLQVVSN